MTVSLHELPKSHPIMWSVGPHSRVRLADDGLVQAVPVAVRSV